MHVDCCYGVNHEHMCDVKVKLSIVFIVCVQHGGVGWYKGGTWGWWKNLEEDWLPMLNIQQGGKESINLHNNMWMDKVASWDLARLTQ